MSAQPKPEPETNPWAIYEQRKAQLPEGLSPQEREAELRRIADELGI